MKIVAFSPEHEAGVVDLIVSIQRGEFGIEITAEQQPDLRSIPDYYQRCAGNFWVALVRDRVVGTISLLDIGSGQAALRKMFVHPDFRGPAHAVGAQLLETLVSWARRHEVRQIFLGTTAFFLAAHRFYEKNGFREITRAELPDSFPVMEVDTRFFQLLMETD